MRTLEDFDLCVLPGEISLCEIDGRIQYSQHGNNNVNIFTTAVEKHPQIHITRESLHSALSGDEGKTLFLPVDIPFLKRLTQAYYEQGFREALRTAASHDLVLISKPAALVLELLKYAKKIQVSLNPASSYSSRTLINNYSQTRNWINHSIRCLTWHPHCTKLAVATCDDSVRIFSAEGNFIPLLRSNLQKNITSLAWRPMSNSEIAVGHGGGIIVWNIDPHSLVSRPSVSNATILYRLEHKPVLSIAWGIRGDILVSAAANDRKLLVWDVELHRTSSLKRPGGSGNTFIKWSPTGDKLFSATTGLVFRVWDCLNWENERWEVLTGRVQSACWTKCGTNLIFATNTEPIIYGLVVKSEVIFASDKSISDNQAVRLFDVTKCEINGVMVGGLVQSLESDPKGKHLAVLFADTNCVAIFNITKQQSVQLISSSLVVGLPEERPSSIAFQQNFTAGACLTIGWSSGRVQYFPIVYSDLKQSELETSRPTNLSLYNSTSFGSPKLNMSSYFSN